MESRNAKVVLRNHNYRNNVKSRAGQTYQSSEREYERTCVLYMKMIKKSSDFYIIEIGTDEKFFENRLFAW